MTTVPTRPSDRRSDAQTSPTGPALDPEVRRCQKANLDICASLLTLVVTGRWPRALPRPSEGSVSASSVTHRPAEAARPVCRDRTCDTSPRMGRALLPDEPSGYDTSDWPLAAGEGLADLPAWLSGCRGWRVVAPGLACCGPGGVASMDRAGVTVDSVERHRSARAQPWTQSSSRAGLPSGRSPRPTPHQPSVLARAR